VQENYQHAICDVKLNVQSKQKDQGDIILIVMNRQQQQNWE